MHKKKKGEIGYLKYSKKKSVLITIVMFGVSFLIFLMGYLSTHSKANLLTIVAMLGMLPASKSGVSAILFLRQKSCNAGIYEKILPHVKNLPAAFELVLTSYDKNFPLSAVVVKNNYVYAYTENEACDCPACEKHILDILKKNGYHAGVKAGKDVHAFINRLDSLQDTSVENEEKDLEIRELILAISV